MTDTANGCAAEEQLIRRLMDGQTNYDWAALREILGPARRCMSMVDRSWFKKFFFEKKNQKTSGRWAVDFDGAVADGRK